MRLIKHHLIMHRHMICKLENKTSTPISVHCHPADSFDVLHPRVVEVEFTVVLPLCIMDFNLFS